MFLIYKQWNIRTIDQISRPLVVIRILWLLAKDGDIPINLFITYPFYAATMIPMETIVGMYSALLPSVDTLEECLLIFNLPFTLLKGAIVTGLTFLVYKPLSVLIKGKGD